MNARQVERALGLLHKQTKFRMGAIGNTIKYALTASFIAAAYASTRFFKSMHDGAVDIQKQFENIKLGIETSMLIAGRGKGMSQAARENFALERVNDLREAALLTKMQFEELGGAYAKLLAPMLAGGIPVKEHVNLMVLLANAVSAITSDSQAQLQLLQETQALLQGRFDPRSVLATSLIQSPADRKAYRQAITRGKTYEFLAPRLRELSSVGPRVAQTAAGKESNIRQRYIDVFREVSKNYFAQYHTLLDSTYTLVQSKEFNQVLRSVFKLLETLLGQVNKFIAHGGGLKAMKVVGELTSESGREAAAGMALSVPSWRAGGQVVAMKTFGIAFDAIGDALASLFNVGENIQKNLKTGVKIDPQGL